MCELLNAAPSQTDHLCRILCAGDCLQSACRTDGHSLRTMRRDLRQSLPDLGPSGGPDVFRRHARSHSVAGTRAKSPVAVGRWTPAGHQRVREEGSRKGARRKNLPGLSDPKASTIHQHYYPEGGWGWIVLCCALLTDVVSSTVHLSVGFFALEIRKNFLLERDSIQPVVAAYSSTVFSFLLSPLVIALTKRHSVRLVAMLGNIVTSLSSLFTSFATQLHQVYLSCGLLGGLGEVLVRDTSMTIFGQYFKRRRHQVDIIYLVLYGIGIATLPLLFSYWIRTVGWRRSFQILAGMQSATCFVALLYRPASLYHPQRRAILHIKSLQKRSKTKDKASVLKEKKPFLDFSVLKSKTVQILICGTALISFGITAPFTLLIEEMERDGLNLYSMCQIQVNLGLAVSVGAFGFGLLATQNNSQCIVAKQYLCQTAAFLLSCWFLAFPTLNDFHGYVLFVWVYGICYGGYIYTLKACVFEKVRARNYARTWSFIMCSQSLPSIVGICIIYHLNRIWGYKRGYYISAATIFFGSMSLFFIDIHKRNMRKKKQLEMERNENDSFLKQKNRRPSQDTILEIVIPKGYDDVGKAQELTCISEEILVDNYIEDYIDDCITSCNKEEKFLMLSEFENNLFKTEESLEKERTLPKDYDSENYCAMCLHTRGCEKLYPLRRAKRTISNIDVIEEVTSL